MRTDGGTLACHRGRPRLRGVSVGRGRQTKESVSRPVSRVLYGPGALRRRNVAAIHLGRTLPSASCNLPGWLGRKTPGSELPRHPYSVLLPVGFAVPFPLPATRWALTPPFHPCPASISADATPRGVRPKCRRGGLLSVALSLGSPPPAISRHRISMEPGLSSPAAFRLSHARPPGRLTLRIKAFARRNTSPARRFPPGRGRPIAISCRSGSSPWRNRLPKRGSCAWRRARHCI